MFIKNETALLSAGIALWFAGTHVLPKPGCVWDLLRPLASSWPMWVDVGMRVMETQLSIKVPGMTGAFAASANC